MQEEADDEPSRGTGARRGRIEREGSAPGHTQKPISQSTPPPPARGAGTSATGSGLFPVPGHRERPGGCGNGVPWRRLRPVFPRIVGLQVEDHREGVRGLGCLPLSALGHQGHNAGGSIESRGISERPGLSQPIQDQRLSPGSPCGPRPRDGLSGCSPILWPRSRGTGACHAAAPRSASPTECLTLSVVSRWALLPQERVGHGCLVYA